MTSLNKFRLYAFPLFWKNKKSRHYGHKYNVCFSKPMYITVVILLRTFNPPNVAELKIDHVSLVVWYKHFDRRLMRAPFLRTVQPYRQFLDINSLLYRPKIARELTIPRSFILCRVKRATSKTTKELTRMFIIPRSFIHCRAKQARYTRFLLLRTTSGADFVSVITRIGNSGALEIISYLVYKHMK